MAQPIASSAAAATPPASATDRPGFAAAPTGVARSCTRSVAADLAVATAPDSSPVTLGAANTAEPVAGCTCE